MIYDSIHWEKDRNTCTRVLETKEGVTRWYPLCVCLELKPGQGGPESPDFELKCVEYNDKKRISISRTGLTDDIKLR